MVQYNRKSPLDERGPYAFGQIEFPKPIKRVLVCLLLSTYSHNSAVSLCCLPFMPKMCSRETTNESKLSFAFQEGERGGAISQIRGIAKKVSLGLGDG